jgi:hypothetical protein
VNSSRVAHSEWRGVFGLLAFIFTAPLELVMLGNIYLLLGGEV